jgi:chromosome segregation ATPase
MDPRPKLPPEGSPSAGIDLDRTDELPIPDLKAFEAAAHDRLAETWIQPGLSLREAAAEARAAGPGVADPLQIAVANLREAQDLLASRGAHLIDVERALEEAHAARSGAERRVEQLTEELAAARAAAAQRETERTAAEAEAHAAAQRGEVQHATELAGARGAAGQREAELGAELERARAAAGQQVSDLAAELTARDRSQAALQRELEQARTRAATYFESLQSAERHRSLLEGQLSDLEDEIEAHETGHARMTRELAGRDMRTGELESDLGDRAARIAALDSQVAALGAALRQRDDELMQLRAVGASLSAALETARAAGTAASARVAEHESALAEARSRGSALEAQLAAERRSGAGRSEELTRVRGVAEEWAGALRTFQDERSRYLASIAAGEARVKQLEDRMAEQVEMRRTLQIAADAAVARAHELEADVRAAEENIARLESQLRGRAARVAELEKANQQWRQTLDESDAAHAATGTQLREGAHAEAGAGGAREPAADGAARLLIRSDGGREVVHVLGRKTTIGRTADNDLQIDVKHISRHHAVILAGPAHTIIEDLNSTNGVMVNGRRVTRQVLNDGDRVTLARAEYRFAVRRSGEKR